MSAQQLSHFLRQLISRPQFLQVLLAVLTDAEAEARAEDMSDLLLAAECRKLYIHDRARRLEQRAIGEFRSNLQSRPSFRRRDFADFLA